MVVIWSDAQHPDRDEYAGIWRVTGKPVVLHQLQDLDGDDADEFFQSGEVIGVSGVEIELIGVCGCGDQ
jgi:hypothetical protein